MSDLLSHRRIFLITLTLTIGLGIALALPLLANAQGQAPGFDYNTSYSNFLWGTSRLPEELSGTGRNPKVPSAPGDCFATKDGVNIYVSSDASALQAAVDLASPGDIIKLAGICDDVNPRFGLTQTVLITKSLTLAGGYKETDWTTKPAADVYTKLDAKKLGRVVVIDGDVHVTLKNLYITNGRAADGSISNYGGGIYSNAHMTMTNSVVFSNTAGGGGGIASDTDNAMLLENVTISGNEAEFGGGLVQNMSELSMNNVKFLDNSAREGGGMLTSVSSPTLTRVTFSGNSAIEEGGGLYSDNSSPVLNDCSFVSNKAVYGGGLYGDKSDLKLTNSSFTANSGDFGGGLLNENGSALMRNMSFTGNKALIGGGLIYDYGNSTLVNATLTGNRAKEFGGGMVVGYGSAAVQNSIFWNNKDKTGSNTITASLASDNSTITVTHSLLQASGGSGEGWIGGSYIDGGQNIDSDPLFIEPANPSNAPTITGNPRLQPGSPAIDAGKNLLIAGVLYDLDNNQRIIDGDGDGLPTIDMGAFEYTLKAYIPIVFAVENNAAR